MFAPLSIDGIADAGFLAERACTKFGWPDAGQVAFFRVPGGRERALAVETDPSLAADILVSANKLAVDEAVEPGSWLLARVAPPPAAAPGASRRRAGGHRAP